MTLSKTELFNSLISTLTNWIIARTVGDKLPSTMEQTNVQEAMQDTAHVATNSFLDGDKWQDFMLKILMAFVASWGLRKSVTYLK